MFWQLSSQYMKSNFEFSILNYGTQIPIDVQYILASHGGYICDIFSVLLQCSPPKFAEECKKVRGCIFGSFCGPRSCCNLFADVGAIVTHYIVLRNPLTL